ncbi:universal stress protein [Thermococcus argininiproducens]|uniref:Universal stress protein n=1 Tax=Thermococcus argininiproducens TaxID=2866384 RepID=A0A9E7M9Q7_9EURY|nr:MULTISPECIES: universal stress protein [Thermococcus]KPU63331.1 universal stress protein [Thermococcus sp. EP1]USG99675.1 universal stress protein [Thermococcus argininiproducens]
MRILVLIDGSKWSQKAALHALTIAKKKNAKIVLFSVLDRREAKAVAFNLGARQGSFEKIRSFEEEVWNNMKRSIQEVMGEMLRFCQSEGVNCSIKIVEGIAKDKILEEANSGKYSLVVMGAYGKSGKTRIGSLLEEIAGNIRPPLLIVR